MTKVFQHGPHRVEDGNHLRPCLNDRVELVPLADEAIGAVTRLDEASFAKSLWTGSLHARVGCDEVLFPADFHTIANHVVCRHRWSPISIPPAPNATPPAK